MKRGVRSDRGATSHQNFGAVVEYFASDFLDESRLADPWVAPQKYELGNSRLGPRPKFPNLLALADAPKERRLQRIRNRSQVAPPDHLEHFHAPVDALQPAETHRFNNESII